MDPNQNNPNQNQPQSGEQNPFVAFAQAQPPTPAPPSTSPGGPAGIVPPVQPPQPPAPTAQPQDSTTAVSANASQPGSLPLAGAGGQSAPKSNNKMGLFIVLGILLLVVLGVIYLMVQGFSKQNEMRAIPTPTQTPIPTNTPTPTPLSEEDIDTIDLGSPAADLKNIDEDVNQL